MTGTTFTNARGQALSARLERPPSGPVRATAVFAHCFTCSKDLKAARRLSRALASRGIAVLSFDFAGLGSSDGDFAATTFSSDVEDLLAAARYLEDVERAPSLLVGHSLGGAAALTAAAKLGSVRAVATVGAPADVEHVTNVFSEDLDTIREKGEAVVQLAGRPFTVRAGFVADLERHRLLETVRGLDAATLFLHSPLDATVGVDNARELFEAAKHPKSFVSLDEADHLMSDERDARYAAEVIASWAARYLPEVDERAGVAGATAAVSASGGDYADDVARALTTEGLRTEVSSRGFTMVVDEPAEVGGTETGPTPYDYLAASLASCTSLTLRIHADREGYALDEVLVEVRNRRTHAEDGRRGEPGLGGIHVLERVVTVKGDLSEGQRDDLVRVAERCPVHRTLEGQVEVVTTVSDGSS